MFFVEVFIGHVGTDCLECFGAMLFIDSLEMFDILVIYLVQIVSLTIARFLA